MDRTTCRHRSSGRPGVHWLMILALAGHLGCQVQAGRPGRPGAADSSSTTPVPVEVETVGTGAITARLQLNGMLSSEAEIKVFPLVSGHVGRVLVEEGARVRSGDTLLVLEDAEILLNERRMRLEMEKAEADLARIRQLASSRLVSDQDLADADFAARRARLSWESASLTVARSRVAAPISGVVGRRLVQEGDFVATGTQLFTLVDDSRLIAVLDVPERELTRLRLRQTVRLDVAAAAEPVVGWIKRISPVVDPASGTVRVTVGIEDPSRRLRAGMYARFLVITDTKDEAVLVSKRALVYDRDLTYVWVAQDSTVERRTLVRGYEDEERLEALSGIAPGERLVTVGQSALKTGSPIRIIKADGREVAPPVETADGADAASGTKK
ncbi:MAG: efflux RND transporter periplasmic adaptor subunit [bacterium]|nr:efflux RND transporter periplasmic adaptor subunit [bacterium]